MIMSIRILKDSWNRKVSKQFKELGNRRGINKERGWESGGILKEKKIGFMVF